MFHAEMQLNGRSYPFWITSQEKMLGVFTEQCDKCETNKNKLPKPTTPIINTNHNTEEADVFNYKVLSYIRFMGDVYEDNWSTYLPSYS